MTRARLTTASNLVSTSHFMSQFALDPATTTGLTLGFTAGFNSLGSTVNAIAASTVTLVDDATNWVHLHETFIDASVLPSLPSVLYKVVTASGVITSITDHRGTIPTNKTAFTG